MRLERRIDDALQDVWQSQIPVETVLARHRLRIVDLDENPPPKPIISGGAAIAAFRRELEDEKPVLVRKEWRGDPYEAWSADYVRGVLDSFENDDLG